MRGLEVHLNGNMLCTAGIGVDAVLNTIVDVIGRKNDYDMTIRVGGLENNEFLIGHSVPFMSGMKSGSIRIVEVEATDVPVKRMPNPS